MTSTAALVEEFLSKGGSITIDPETVTYREKKVQDKRAKKSADSLVRYYVAPSMRPVDGILDQ